MDAPIGKIIRNPQVINAMGTSTIAAPSQQAVSTAVVDAKKAGTDAQTTANAAKSTADAAKSTADAAKSAAATADGKAVAAQTAATNANNNANNRVPTSRKINGMDLTADRSITAAQVGAYSKAESDARYQLKGQASGVTLGAEELYRTPWSREGALATHPYCLEALYNVGYGLNGMEEAYPPQYSLPANVVVCNQGSEGTGRGAKHKQRIVITYRKITGGI